MNPYTKTGTPISAAELAGILRRHALWVKGGAKGRKACLAGAYLRARSFIGADLRGADLRGASLRGACLRGADLGMADLAGADLSGADLLEACLWGADLQGANLSGADLRGANLTQACLAGADLRDAALGGASLRGAVLRRARLRESVLDSVSDLRGIDLQGADYCLPQDRPATTDALREGRTAALPSAWGRARPNTREAT